VPAARKTRMADFAEEKLNVDEVEGKLMLTDSSN
jgi:hypothetical protein